MEIAGNLGAFFGSKLGTYLGGNSVVTQLAAGTVLGAVGKEASKAITSFAMGGSFALEVSVQNAFGTLTGNSNIGALEGGGIAAISSLLMSELADTLNLHGFEGGLFQAASGGYLGTTLAAHIMVPQYAEGAVRQQIGSSVGGMRPKRCVHSRRKIQARHLQRGAAGMHGPARKRGASSRHSDCQKWSSLVQNSERGKLESASFVTTRHGWTRR